MTKEKMIEFKELIDHLEKLTDQLQKLTAQTEEAEDKTTEFKITELKGFDQYQIYEIYLGLKQGLTVEQVLTFTSLEFQWRQMEKIRLGYQRGLTTAQALKVGRNLYKTREEK